MFSPRYVLQVENREALIPKLGSFCRAAAQGSAECVDELLGHPRMLVNALDRSDTRSTPLDFAAAQLEQRPDDASYSRICDALIRRGAESSGVIIPRAALLIQRNWRGYMVRIHSCY